jgi:hypothetical protein
MFNELATGWFRWLGGRPAFRVHGKARPEKRWRVIDVYATRRRDQDSRWFYPFFRGTCITWTSHVIAVGWDFAEEVLREQVTEPASRDNPVEVAGGRVRNSHRRWQAGAEPWPSASEILAHECGHTAQAVRLYFLYWPIGASFTLFREGPHWYNHFENQASEQGQFGGILTGSVLPSLWQRVQRHP